MAGDLERGDVREAGAESTNCQNSSSLETNEFLHLAYQIQSMIGPGGVKAERRTLS